MSGPSLELQCQDRCNNAPSPRARRGIARRTQLRPSGSNVDLVLPDTTTHILQLVTTALDEFETAPVPATVRRAWRIARLRSDIVEALRFAMELGTDEDLGEMEPSADLSTSRDLAEATFTAGRSTTVDPKLLGLDRIEVLTMRSLDMLRVDPAPYEDEISLRSRIENENKRVVVNDILARIRNDAFQYLMRCETTLRLSITGQRIFDRHRKRVDRLLRAVAPEVLDMLNAAIRRSVDGDDPEARVHALTSCRRVLTAVADIVYPARDEPRVDSKGVSRNVGANQYRNRILAAVEAGGPTTHHRALAASINDFAPRLDRLDELTQKGVHEHPTVEDVDFGVIQTYLIAGEVLAVSGSARE